MNRLAFMTTALVMILAAGIPLPGTMAQEQSSDLTVYYSSDVRGEIEPCG